MKTNIIQALLILIATGVVVFGTLTLTNQLATTQQIIGD